MSIQIISWDKEKFFNPKSGNWEPAYRVFHSTSPYFFPTEEQKRELKKQGKKVVDGKIVEVNK